MQKNALFDIYIIFLFSQIVEQEVLNKFDQKIYFIYYWFYNYILLFVSSYILDEIWR